jgi:hypothetical protein
MMKTFSNCNVNACCKYVVVTAVLAEKDNRPWDYPRAGGGHVWRGAEDYWIAIDRGDREFCCYTHSENTKHVEQRVVREYTVRILSGWTIATRHLPRNLRMRIIALLTEIISWSVDNRCITYVSKGDCFRSSVSVGTGLFHDAIDGSCYFFSRWPRSVRS